jgi:hypothetical protein
MSVQGKLEARGMIVAINPAACASPALGPEQRLFLGVILNAIMEAAGTNRGGDREPKASHTRMSARAWLEQAGHGFQSVCEFAGLEPENVRRGALEYLERITADPCAAITIRRTRQHSPVNPYRGTASVH